MKRIKEGLEIIAKYEDDADFCAEHDVIYVGGEESTENMSDEDKHKMDELGWFIDEEFYCWSHFC